MKIPKEYSNEKMLKMKRGWSGCKTIREGSEGVAFSSGGEGRSSGTRDSRVCGILISDIPETGYHRTGEAAAQEKFASVASCWL